MGEAIIQLDFRGCLRFCGDESKGRERSRRRRKKAVDVLSNRKALSLYC